MSILNYDEKICVIGLGYIGLPTASLLATKGFEVYGVDVNEQTINMINCGQVHIYEPDLDVMVKAAVQSGKLKAFSEPKEADVFIIAVPTPFTDEHSPNLSYIQDAVKSIAPYVKPENLIILESTSPVGTTEKVGEWLREIRPDLRVSRRRDGFEDKKGESVYLSHCPERVLPGQILRELVENDRIIGGIDERSAQKTKALYQKFVKGELLLSDSRTAEMSKLTENAFRDVNIAFANELSLICEELDINVWELIHLANRHPRVNILQPGPGVGGHCIAVDPWFIVDAAPKKAKLIRAAREVNEFKPKHIVNKIVAYGDKFKKPVIACLGLAFKPDIDDLRESPAVQIVESLAGNPDYQILAVEPHVARLPQQLIKFENIRMASITEAIHEADVVVLLVNHKVFSCVNLSMLGEKIVIDTRGMWQ
ncbi:UDP-N-acetyl-D-mannosamine dehydrogenase [Propionispora hippei]|uniref:UDP-N-acetyl-D-mannosaminuronic acid dehydrogenase n=1 Tax=Propionispora hippei DSM 15287 TaxID=1123003 RepID=A0A1M6K3A3_9FIRM|nr:UDP-N-acetyl-D-mannosamine dehydrogenase [Propionispora hippei]SHJ53375.1 UDP-N-acetyl-D-mannosaminuronic acid dehydrogenase [Propionispora hippei DSM 15287]